MTLRGDAMPFRAGFISLPLDRSLIEGRKAGFARQREDLPRASHVLSWECLTICCGSKVN